MEPLKPEAYYHIFNRANGSEPIFCQPGNEEFFLSKYKEYISPIADTFCYCLMKNHFHFLIRIKSEKELASVFPEFSQEAIAAFPKFHQDLQGFGNLAGLLSKRFGNFFNSYAKAFNKQQDRKGSLFMKNFKRKRVTDTIYLRKLVHYIHLNPVEAGLCKYPLEWKYSSYMPLLNDNRELLKTAAVFEWFDDKANFIYIHQHVPEFTGIEY